jgi:hypothetical protein
MQLYRINRLSLCLKGRRLSRMFWMPPQRYFIELQPFSAALDSAKQVDGIWKIENRPLADASAQ